MSERSAAAPVAVTNGPSAFLVPRLATAFIFALCWLPQAHGGPYALEPYSGSDGSIAGPQGPTPPNIVLIIGDDQSWTDFGFMGHEAIETPHIDRLAREGLVFRRGYVPTALCRPSLATMVTGLYAHQHMVVGNDPWIPPDGLGLAYGDNPRYRVLNRRVIERIEAVPTLPRLLAEGGYVSFQAGKWWEGSYERGGFTAGMTHGDPDRGGRHGDVGLEIGRQGLGPMFDFIESVEGRPFFIWYAPFLPHTPHNPPERLLAKYRTAGRPIELARYYAMCEWFDETVGTLLDHLESNGLDENTLVVFITDNGWIQRTPETPVPEGWRTSFAPRSKQSPYEGGVRTPILLRWPGTLEPGEREALASSIDLAPTILAAAGLEPPPSLPGVDLLALARGEAPARDTLFGEGFAHDIADVDNPAASLLYRWCIEGRWKLVTTHTGRLGRAAALHPDLGRAPELYDLERDPHETRNLAEVYPEVARRLMRKLDGWWSGRD